MCLTPVFQTPFHQQHSVRQAEESVAQTGNLRLSHGCTGRALDDSGSQVRTLLRGYSVSSRFPNFESFYTLRAKSLAANLIMCWKQRPLEGWSGLRWVAGSWVLTLLEVEPGFSLAPKQLR